MCAVICVNAVCKRMYASLLYFTNCVYYVEIHKFGLFLIYLNATFLFPWLTFLSSSVYHRTMSCVKMRAQWRTKEKNAKTNSFHHIYRSLWRCGGFLYKSIACIVPLFRLSHIRTESSCCEALKCNYTHSCIDGKR